MSPDEPRYKNYLRPSALIWVPVLPEFVHGDVASFIPTSMHIRPFQPDDEDAVIALWRRCDLVRPQNDPRKDIARKLAVGPEMFLLAVSDGAIVGSVMCGYEGHRGWLNYLAVDSDHRLRGFGRELMTEAERVLLAVGCPKINLQVRSTNQSAIAFYRAIGFAIDDVISMGKRLKQD